MSLQFQLYLLSVIIALVSHTKQKLTHTSQTK